MKSQPFQPFPETTCIPGAPLYTDFVLLGASGVASLVLGRNSWLRWDMRE
jgi:hypothetical protein